MTSHVLRYERNKKKGDVLKKQLVKKLSQISALCSYEMKQKKYPNLIYVKQGQVSYTQSNLRLSLKGQKQSFLNNLPFDPLSH